MSDDIEEDLDELEIDAIVDTVPVVAAEDLDEGTTLRLISDIAQKIHPYSTIAARYGMNLDQLKVFCSVPAITRRIKAKRAIWESDDSAVDRARKYCGLTVIDAAPVMDRIIHDPVVPNATKIDTFKALAKIAGLEAAAKGDGPTGSSFAVSIVFSGGQIERITTVQPPAPPTIEGESEAA